MDDGMERAWFAAQEWPADAASWERQRKARWAWRKYRKARHWARALRCAPGVRMIAVGNALGYGNGRDEGDIDLVIVTAPGRLWTARLVVVALLKLFRQRPGEHGRDALCPSFFLTTEALNLEPLQLPRQSSSELPPDPYLLFWPTQLTVFYDVGGTYDAFWGANRAWVQRWLPGAVPRAVHPRLCVARCAVRMGGGRWIERLAKRVQEPRLRRAFPRANSDTKVIIRDDMLKLHADDRRAEFREQWSASLRSVEG